MSGPLVNVECTECHDGYAVFKVKAEIPPFLCRRCRLVHFAEAVEQLMAEGPLGAEELDDNAPEALRRQTAIRNLKLFTAQLKELRELHLGA